VIKEAADQPSALPSISKENLGRLGFSLQRASNLEPAGYPAVFNRVFIPLAALEGACRNYPLSRFLLIVVNPFLG
jgi:hypothetical protein